MAPNPRGRAKLLTLMSLLAVVWISSPLGPARASTPPTSSTFASLDPDGGEFLQGGALYAIRWNVTHGIDPELLTAIDLSLDGGLSFPTMLATGNYTTGGASFDWPVPFLNTSTARIRVCVWDIMGNSDCRVSAGPFTIDSADPAIFSADPPDGSTNVLLDRPLHVVFSESMDTSNVTWSLVPLILLDATWSATDDLWLTPRNGWTACTVYTIGIAGDDLAGNPLPPGLQLTFQTNCGNPYLLSTSPGEAEVDVLLNATISATFSEAMDPSSLAWSLLPATNLTPVWYAANATVTFFHPTGALPPCTTFVMEVWANDTAGNSLIIGGAANPWYFVTTCASPYFVTTMPANGETDVLRDDLVVISFSEGMDPGSVFVTFLPTVPVFEHLWDSAYLVLTVGHGLFRPCTQYRTLVDGADPSGLPLAPGPVSNPFGFTTSCGAGASLRLLTPQGGESWTGGSNHTVLVEIDNLGPFERTFVVTVAYQSSGGSQTGTIGTQDVVVLGGAVAIAPFPWILPLSDAGDAVVQAAATEGDVTVEAGSAAFEIDSTRPTVVTATPSGPRNRLPVELLIAFSEPMGPPVSDPLAVHPPVGRSVTWTSSDRLFVALSGVQPCTPYDAAIGAPLTDDSDPGNLLIPLAWSFATTCAPTIDLVTPVGGNDGTGGSVHEIAWTTEDLDDQVLDMTLSYSRDAGATWVVVEADLVVEVGLRSYPWTLPRMDGENILVRAEVTDSVGDTAWAVSQGFGIDSTPPSLLASNPPDGASDVATTRDIVLAWSERVNHASFEAALAIGPPVGSVAFAWSTGIGDADVLTISHDLLRPGTEYALAFTAAAKDASDPGNPLADPLRITFRTQPPPRANPPVAKAVGPSEVQVGERVAFDATTSTGNITGYAWRITDDQGRVVAGLLGSRPAYVFRDPGRYRVVLTVTDAFAATDDDALEISVTSDPTPTIVLGGAILFASAMSLTEGGKFFLLKLLFVPLYARRQRNELLEHQTRGMILGYLMVHPGDTYSHLKRNLQLSNGTLSYHLVVLEREGILRAQTYGVHKRFFPIGVRVPEDGGGLHEVQMRMLGAIREVPGLAVKDIAGALGITSQHALYHIRGLAARGLVRLERKGVRLRCFPDEGRASPRRQP